MPSHPGRGPFSMGEKTAPRVLLLHGLTGAPSELWPLACGLVAAGFRVDAPVLPGHGETPEALREVRAEALLERVRAIAADPSDPPAAVVGLSMGALLAIVAATGLPASGRLVLLAPAIVMAGRTRLFDALGALPWLPDRLLGKGTPYRGVPAQPFTGFAIGAAHAAEAAQPRPGADGRYDRIPYRWAQDLRRVREAALQAASDVRAPTLVLHGLEDQTTSSESAIEAAAWLRGAPVSIHFLIRSPHLLALGPERGEVAARVATFLAPLLPTPTAESQAESA